MKTKIIKRYTDVPALLYLLKHQAITLLDPKSWDDSNDFHFLSVYKDKLNLKTVLALCFTEAVETYHHWRVFAAGSSGVCIAFKRDALIKVIKNHNGIRFGSVDYVPIKKLEGGTLKIQKLPFTKRYAFQGEKEFRIIYENKQLVHNSIDLQVPLDCINKISLKPWIPKSLADSLRKTLSSIDGCHQIKIVRSRLIDSAKWKTFGSSAR